MAIITLQFPTLNVSVQPTDVVYACLTQNNQAGVNHPNATINTKPVAIGVVIGTPPVNHATATITVDTAGYPPVALTTLHYLFFSKDKRANMSGILGYYALVEYRNHSSKQAEIFATSTEFFPSSK